MDNLPRILVVDDDLEIRTLLRDYLEDNGFRATTAADGKSMWRALDEGQYALVVLDIMMPGDDGLVLCRDLRARSTLPVLMLTARGDETDRIVGLEMGADDYLPKPFNPRELLARIKAILRRAGGAPRPVERGVRRLRFHGWTLDADARHLLSPDAVVVSLSGAEYKLLRALADHANRVLSRDQLLDLSRGRDAVPFDRSIDVLISRLRRRLGDDGKEPRIIKTVRGEGYVLVGPVHKEP